MKANKGIRLATYCLIPSVGYPILVMCIGLIHKLMHILLKIEEIGILVVVMAYAWILPPAFFSMLFLKNRSITGIDNGLFRGEFGIQPDGFAGWSFTFFFWLCAGFGAWLIGNTFKNSHNQPEQATP